MRYAKRFQRSWCHSPKSSRRPSPKALKASFSENAPADIEYIVITSNIEEVGCHWQDNEQMPGAHTTRSYGDTDLNAQAVAIANCLPEIATLL
jgi:hypothetical protein